MVIWSFSQNVFTSVSSDSTKLENPSYFFFYNGPLLHDTSLNLKFYNTFPEDTLSAYCLADVQELYDASGAYLKAVAYGDTIAERYPEFSNIILVLEKNAAILDFNLSWNDHIKKITTPVSRAIGILFKLKCILAKKTLLCYTMHLYFLT